MSDPIIRPAYPDEDTAITALMRRSQQHWGYDEAFMTAHAESLLITSEDIEEGGLFVLMVGESMAGFVNLEASAELEVMVLNDLFVDPPFIGQGYGRRLWDFACEVARKRSFRAMIFESEPNAIGFYLHLGGVQTGDAQSTIIPGRVLPAMRYDLGS